jgi:hypothetical protein
LTSDNFGTFIQPSDALTSIELIAPLPETFKHKENIQNRNMCFQTVGLSKNLCENLCFTTQFSIYQDQKYIDSLNDENPDPFFSREFTYNYTKNTECMEICKYVAGIEDKEDCPYGERCQQGCPCESLKCVKGLSDHNLALIKIRNGTVSEAEEGIDLYKVSQPPLELSKVPQSDNITIVTDSFFCTVWFRGAHYVLVTRFGIGILVYKILPSGDIVLLEILEISRAIMHSARMELCASGLYELKYDSSTRAYERDERIFFCPRANWTNTCFIIKLL